MLEFEGLEEKDMDKREISFSVDSMCSTFRLLFVAGVDESGIFWVVTMSVPSSVRSGKSFTTASFVDGHQQQLRSSVVRRAQQHQQHHGW
jgi:hypothetical protein